MRNLEILGKRLNRLSNLNIYENSRKREYIEARSVFCVIAYKYYDYTYAQIAGYLRSKGRQAITQLYYIRYEALIFIRSIQRIYNYGFRISWAALNIEEKKQRN